MADQNSYVPSGAPTTTELALPTAAIICIAIGAYVVVIVIILIVRQCLLSRGICGECNLCGKEGEPQCCECWIALAESCNCCQNPSITSCLDSCCPQRKQMSFADVVTCQCCAGGQGCCGDEPCCAEECGNCNCNCQCQECDSINCLCFELKLKEAPPDYDDGGPGQYGGQYG